LIFYVQLMVVAAIAPIVSAPFVLL
jgi:hypothetical protein